MMYDSGFPVIELPMYPYVKETSRDKTHVRYEVIDSRSGETLAWLEENINPNPRPGPFRDSNDANEPNQKRLKTDHAAVAPRSRKEGDLVYDPTSIFVSGMDIWTTKHDILKHFASLGQITRVTRLHNNDTGKFNGSAYVQYRNISSAEQALFLDGSYLRECIIIVQRKLRSDEERQKLQEEQVEEGIHEPEYFEEVNIPLKTESHGVVFDQFSIIVTNLCPNTTPLELAAHFQKQNVGDIHSVNFNRSRVGEAVIRFKERKGADDALALNQSLLEGFNICVQRSVRSKPRVPLPPQSVEFNNNLSCPNGYHGQPFKMKDRVFDNTSIYVSNIDHCASDSELAGHFRDVGDIARLTRLKNKATGYNTGNAYIQFKQASSVGWALELNGSYLRDSCLSIQRKMK